MENKKVTARDIDRGGGAYHLVTADGKRLLLEIVPSLDLKLQDWYVFESDTIYKSRGSRVIFGRFFSFNPKLQCIVIIDSAADQHGPLMLPLEHLISCYHIVTGDQN